MNSSKTNKTKWPVSLLVKWLLGAWLGMGLITTAGGFLGWLYQPLSLLLLLPLIVFMLLAITLFKLLADLSQLERAILFILIGIWSIHGLGLLVPETGFDAVWYHLPIIDQFTRHHAIYFIPEYYQSLNPLFSDLIFLLGYHVGGETGAKLVAYGLALTLMAVCYSLSRLLMSRWWSLLTILVVSTFQVITWQASSFYIDVAKALWEVGSIWLLIEAVAQDKRPQQLNIIASGVVFGASLASKLFSLLLWPVMVISVGWLTRKWQQTVIFLLASFVVVLPFYLFTGYHSGTPWLSFSINASKVGEFGGTSTGGEYLMRQTLNLWQSPWYLTFQARDYTTFLFVLLWPFLLMKTMWQQPKIQILLLFAVAQWLMWWYLPPLSTRYALSGFMVLLVVMMAAVASFMRKQPHYHRPVVVTIFLAVLINMLPRLVVAHRQLAYILGRQTKTEYLQQFIDGTIDGPLQSWHRF